MMFSLAIVAATLALQPAPAPQDPFAGDIAAFVEQDRAAPPARCTTLFVGSSSIRLWPDLAHEFDFPVTQRGFGGSTIADVNAHFGEIVAPYRPSRIVFYAGDNDIDARKSPSLVIAQFDHFLALKDHALGPTPVYYIAIKPSLARLNQMPRQAEVNDAIRQRAATRADLVYVDVVGPMMKDGVPDPAYLGSDGLHMTRAGYDVWRSAVSRALQEPGASKAPGC